MAKENNGKVSIKFLVISIGFIAVLISTVYGLTVLAQEKFNVRIEKDVEEHDKLLMGPDGIFVWLTMINGRLENIENAVGVKK